MIDQLEALVALARCGTMQRAALELRVTQSAVSKRIAQLEEELKAPLLEPSGRGVKFTARGMVVVEGAKDIIRAYRGLVNPHTERPTGELTIGVSESVLGSWGARCLAAVAAALPEVSIVLHAHRSPVVMERVSAGEYAAGIVAGRAETHPGLHVQPLAEEEMVIVPQGLQKVPLAKAVANLHVIEVTAATWQSAERALARRLDDSRLTLNVTGRVESFTALVQMARAGLVHALVPYGIARAMGVPAASLLLFPKPGLVRPLSLVARSRTFERGALAALAKELPRWFEKHIDNLHPVGRGTT